MFAIAEISSQAVLYCGVGLSLAADGARDDETDMLDTSTTTANAYLVTVPERPADFAGRLYRLNGQGELVRNAAGDAAAALRKKAAQDDVWRRIHAHREDLSDNGGYKVATTAGDKWFHSDMKSKLQQSRLASRAELIQVQGGDLDTAFPLPAPLPAGPLLWKTLDGSKVPLTPRLALAIAAAAEVTEIMIFAVAEYHRATMLSLPDPTGYDFSANWPARYVPA